jgi:hypothetical protein
MGTGTYAGLASGGAIRPMRMLGGFDLKIAVGKFTFSSAYASGGESLPATSLGFAPSGVIVAVFSPVGSATHALNKSKFVNATYDYTNETVLAIGASALAAADGSGASIGEVAAGFDLSGSTVRFIAIGY